MEHLNQNPRNEASPPRDGCQGRRGQHGAVPTVPRKPTAPRRGADGRRGALAERHSAVRLRPHRAQRRSTPHGPHGFCPILTGDLPPSAPTRRAPQHTAGWVRCFVTGRGSRRSAADRTARTAQSRGRTAGALEAALSASALRDVRPIAAHGAAGLTGAAPPSLRAAAPGPGPHRAAQPPRRGANGPGGSAAPNPDVDGAGRRAGRTAVIAGPEAATAGSGWHEGARRPRSGRAPHTPGQRRAEQSRAGRREQRGRGTARSPGQALPEAREAPPHRACAAPRAAAPPNPARLPVARAYGSHRASRGVAAFGRTS